MKVYLLYSSYDDGECYESQSGKHLNKIVDSEEKAKKWIFEQAVEQCNELTNAVSGLVEQRALNYDEDGPYYLPFDEDDIDLCEYKRELMFYLNQLNKLKFGDGTYIVYDSNGYEQYGFTYEVREVE